MASQKFLSSSFLRHRRLARLVVSNPTTIVVSRRTVHVEHHPAAGSPKTNPRKHNTTAPPRPPTAAAIPTVVGEQRPSNSRSRRTRSQRRKRLSLDGQKVPSYKEFVHRFTVLSLYRGFLKCIRDSMPHNQDDLRAQVRNEFQLNKHETDAFTNKQNIAEGQRQFEELKEFTGQSNKYTGESWINIQDADDPRGRVGTNWPWEK